MPMYDFINNATGEVFERMMKLSDRDTFLSENPTISLYYGTPPAIGDPIRLGVKKIDNGFKEVLQKISERTPGGKSLRTASSQFF